MDLIINVLAAVVTGLVVAIAVVCIAGTIWLDYEHHKNDNDL